MSDKNNKKIKQNISVDEYYKGILSANRVILSKAITLVESNLDEHYEIASELIDKCLPHSGNSVRVGITGMSGAGKSTFIETIGMHVIQSGKKIAVLAVDPSSERSKGSILGDKTRMEQLSASENAFIRPSPSGGILGGVGRKTRETIILCEAAGYEVIFIETVGIGQSETLVKSMVDFFLLIVITGAGDELQGIKRGIMEMADVIAINKADGDNIEKAKTTVAIYQNALHLFPEPESKWLPKVNYCSAIEGTNIPEIWKMINKYIDFTRKNGFFDLNRRQQEISCFYSAIDDNLKHLFFSNPTIKQKINDIKSLIEKRKLSPYQAVKEVFKKFFDNKL